MRLPRRYEPYFSDTRDAWVCLICGRRIRHNTAGAQSHVVKHVRENIAKKAALIDVLDISKDPAK